jgi:hypothetical protein
MPHPRDMTAVLPFSPRLSIMYPSVTAAVARQKGMDRFGYLFRERRYVESRQHAER